MAITAATSANRITRKGPGKSLFEDASGVVGSSSTWGQGELLCMDASSFYLRRVAAMTDADTLVGISDNVVTAGKLAGPYDGLTPVDAAQSGPKFAGPKYGVEATLTAKTGDHFTPGCPVYLLVTGDTATVSVTDSGGSGHTLSHIGIYQGPDVASAAAGQQIKVLVGARWPNAAGTILIF